MYSLYNHDISACNTSIFEALKISVKGGQLTCDNELQCIDAFIFINIHMICVCIRNMFESLSFSISHKPMPKFNGELYRCYCYNLYIIGVYYISSKFSLFLICLVVICLVVIHCLRPLFMYDVMNVTVYNTVHEKNNGFKFRLYHAINAR